MADYNGRTTAFRLLIVIEFVVCAALCAITGIDFLRHRMHFPVWFGPPFLAGMFLLVMVIIFYLRELVKAEGPIEMRSDGNSTLIWILLVCSVVCTSALHKFFPFRPDVIEFWRRMSPGYSMLKYNFILTASSLLVIAVLGILYHLGWKRLGVGGLVLLAAVMLVPNDDCGNYFNRLWIEFIGASPLMFMANSAAILIGCCGIFGIRPKGSIAAISYINGCTLAVGLGHLTGIVW